VIRELRERPNCGRGLKLTAGTDEAVLEGAPMRQLILIFASLLVGCGLILDNSPPDPNLLGLDDAAVDASSDAETDAEPPPACDTAADCEIDPCRSAPSCVDGHCVLGDWMDCSELDHGACVRGVCVGGECVQRPEDKYCDDGVECTVGVCAEDGTCAFEANHERCDDGVACTKDYCAPQSVGDENASGCVHVPDDSVCADRLPEDGACTSSICTGRHDTSDKSGCGTVILPDACEADAYCAVDQGQCVPFEPGCLGDDECDDGNECNGQETCVDGICVRGQGDDVCPPSFNPCLEPVCLVEDDGAVCHYLTIDECQPIIDPEPNPIE
jgi:hypothetical protein